MAGVTVTFARDTALVRTVRLIAAAVARRAARDEDFVEEVRLAVGEACGLLAAVSPDDPAAGDPVTVRIILEPTTPRCPQTTIWARWTPGHCCAASSTRSTYDVRAAASSCG
jgi:hypothetical protein